MELLKKLYLINSKSGHEEKIKELVMSELNTIEGLNIKQDSFGNIFITKGESIEYPCVAAHMDEVHLPSVRKLIDTPPTICAVDDKGERVGIGADDKNGVWIALNLLRTEPVLKCALFVQEEKDGDVPGCRGSKACDLSWFDDVKYVLESDRKGAHDIVVKGKETEICGYDFIPVEIQQKYKYWPVHGGSTDVVAMKRRGLGIPCCNLSCGYYNAHKAEEYTNTGELKNCLEFVREIINTI